MSFFRREKCILQDLLLQAFELLFLAGYWRDALALSCHLEQHGLEALVAISLHELRRTGEALRDFIISSLNETDGDMHNSSITTMVTNFLRLNPVTSEDLFVETLDLLLSEFLQECSRISFDSPQAMLITVEIESDLTSQVNLSGRCPDHGETASEDPHIWEHLFRWNSKISPAILID